MATYKIKRIYEPAAKDDGLRVLVDRLWPRGVRKDKMDIWLKEIAPSAELRKWFHAGKGRVEEFAKALETEPVAVIPFDAQLFGTAANNGQVIAEVDPKSGIAETFTMVARAVSGRTEVRRAKRTSLFARFRAKKAG